MSQPDQLSPNAALEVSLWLKQQSRMSGADTDIVPAYTDAMINAGLPLFRMNIAQRFANPLPAAVAMIWTSEGTRFVLIPKSMLSTDAYRGSPFEYVQQHRTLLRKKLVDLDPLKDHATYLEQASAGATEYIALVLEFSDGSVHSCSFTTSRPGGFTDEQAIFIWETRHALASALEPATMRRSTGSLLQAYLGDGPAERLSAGLFSDLTLFSAASLSHYS